MLRMQDIPYTRDKMRNYVRKYKINGMVRAADLPLDTKEDALADVAAAAFAPANQMEVHVDDGYIKTEKVHLRDFTLTDSEGLSGQKAGKKQTAQESENPEAVFSEKKESEETDG